MKRKKAPNAVWMRKADIQPEQGLLPALDKLRATVEAARVHLFQARGAIHGIQFRETKSHADLDDLVNGNSGTILDALQDLCSALELLTFVRDARKGGAEESGRKRSKRRRR
jgi:hypothetical protein